jgi:outer membrane biosynthesis protein TonB
MPGFSASRRFFRPIEPASVTATEAPVKVTETLDYAYGEEGKSQMEMPTVVPEPEVETVPEPEVETVPEPEVETVPEPKKKNTKKKKADN